ncbi:hypothetical protein AHAS_Ahas02G0137000 [Arachis hypogaea]
MDIYVVHLWKVPNRFNDKEINGIEMLFQDIKRGNIVEFSMYVMSNFVVVDKKEKIKTTTNRWTINFAQKTTVLPIPHPNFILETFSFKPIVELLGADKIDDSILIDVIGEVVRKEGPR